MVDDEDDNREMEIDALLAEQRATEAAPRPRAKRAAAPEAAPRPRAKRAAAARAGAAAAAAAAPLNRALTQG